MDNHWSNKAQAFWTAELVPVRPPLWRRILFNPAVLVFTLLVLIVWGVILIGPSAGAAGGCGGG